MDYNSNDTKLSEIINKVNYTFMFGHFFLNNFLKIMNRTLIVVRYYKYILICINLYIQKK